MQAGMLAGMLAGTQTGTQTGRQAGKEAGRQAGKEAGRQAGRQAGKEAGKQARPPYYCIYKVCPIGIDKMALRPFLAARRGDIVQEIMQIVLLGL